MAAAFMTELPTVRFVRKLFLGLVGEGELLVLFELHAGLVECYTAICGCAVLFELCARAVLFELGARAVLEKHHEDEEVDRVIHRLRDARREPLHRDTWRAREIGAITQLELAQVVKVSACQASSDTTAAAVGQSDAPPLCSW